MCGEFSRTKFQCNIPHPFEHKFVGKVFVHFTQRVKAEENLLNLHVANLYALEPFSNTNIVPNFLGKVARWCLSEVSY